MILNLRVDGVDFCWTPAIDLVLNSFGFPYVFVWTKHELLTIASPQAGGESFQEVSDQNSRRASFAKCSRSKRLLAPNGPMPKSVHHQQHPTWWRTALTPPVLLAISELDRKTTPKNKFMRAINHVMQFLGVTRNFSATRSKEPMLASSYTRPQHWQQPLSFQVWWGWITGKFKIIFSLAAKAGHHIFSTRPVPPLNQSLEVSSNLLRILCCLSFIQVRCETRWCN